MELDSTVSCKLQQSVDSHVEKLNYSIVKSVIRCQPFYFYILSLFLFYYQGGFSCRYLDGFFYAEVQKLAVLDSYRKKLSLV